MLNEENIITFAGAGLLIVGCLAAVIGSILHEGRKGRAGRKIHKRYQTNYQRLQTKLALSSGVIQKGTN